MQQFKKLHSKYLASRYLFLIFLALTFFPNFVSAQDITTGLIGHWKFDEGSGTTAGDSSGNNNTGTLTNGPTWTTGKIGGAVSFDGVDDQAILNPVVLNIGSYAVWAKPAFNLDPSITKVILGASGSGSHWRFGGNTFGLYDNYYMEYRGGFGTTCRVRASPVLTDDAVWQQWAHVVVTWNVASGTQIYVNGALAGTSSCTTGSPSFSNHAIGAENNSRFWQGLIDDVRIYNRVLTSSDIQVLYALGSGVPPSNGDAQAPTTPSNLSATAQSSSQINLSWSTSTDNVGVTGYRVERCQGSTCTNFAQVGTPTGTTFNDTGLTGNTTYRYQVRATDAAGNLSGYSSIASGTTQSGTVSGGACVTPTGGQTALEAAANGLISGDWCELSSNNLTWNLVKDQNDGIGTILEYSHQGVWNSTLKKVRFVGGAHGGSIGDYHCVHYDEALNTWSSCSVPPALEGSTAGGVSHTYDHNAIDPATGDHYVRPTPVNEYHVWNGSSWSQIAEDPYSEPAIGTTWDETRGGLIAFTDSRGAKFWNKTTNTWSVLAAPNAFGGFGGSYHFVAEYHPPTGLVWLQDANGQSKHWKLNTNNTVTTLATPPITLGCCGTQGRLSTYDYRTGRFVVANPFNNAMYEYDIVTDTWTALGTNRVPFNHTFDTSNVEAFVTPINAYGGVIMYVVGRNTGANPVAFLYKHATTEMTPYPTLSGLADNTAMEIGPYTCTDPIGEPTGTCRKITDFSGFTYDAKRHRMLMFGGGHATTFTDALSAFDLNTLTWSDLYTPTGCSYMTLNNYDQPRAVWLTGGSGPYPRPVSRHTYDELAVVGDEFIMLGAWIGRGSCVLLSESEISSSVRIAHYDITTGNWSFSETAQGDIAPFGSTPAYMGTAYDPVSGNVVMVGRSGMYLYNPATREKTRSLNYSIGDMGIEGNLVYYPPNQKFYFFGDNNTGAVKVWEVTLDRANPANSAVLLLATSGTPSSNRRPYAYDTKNQVIGGGISGDQFFVFNPMTRAWSSQTMQGANIWGVAFHAFDYDPVNNVYVYISRNPSDNFDRRTWVYRYKNGSGVPSPDTTAPSAPANLSTTVQSSSQINLSWTVSTDNVGVTGYRVERCQGSSCTNFIQISTLTGTTYNDTGLAANTTYRYQVRATDAANNFSGYSSVVSGTTQATTPPPSTKFILGDRVQVSTGPLNVRSTPSTSGTLLGTQATNAIGTVTGGPTYADGYYWWNINYDSGADGWSVEDFLVKTTGGTNPSGCSSEGGLSGRTDILHCEPWENSTWWQNVYKDDGTKYKDYPATGPDNSVVTSTGCIAGNCLKVNCPQYNCGGALAHHWPIPGTQQEAYLRYYIKFAPNWDTTNYNSSGVISGTGGKLPGLADVRTNADVTANGAPDNYGQCGNGGAFSDGIHCWSARADFRNCTSSTSVAPDGPSGRDICLNDLDGKQATTRYGYYWYLPGGTGNQTSQALGLWDIYKTGTANFGTGGCTTNKYALGNWQTPPCGIGEAGLVNDRWYLIEQHIKMNDVGVANGIAQGWIDGVLKYEKTNVEYRLAGHDNLHIRTIWLNVHMGGEGVGPAEDTHIMLDQLVLAAGGRPGAFVSSGTPPPTTLLGDLNNDRTVNNFDWNIMTGVWFTNDPTADLNKDGIVNTADFYFIYINWNVSN